MAGSLEDYRVCEKCGGLYFNFCVNCAKAGTEERVLTLMDKHGLTEEMLVKVLSDMVADGKFPALNLAIAMRDMKPADRHEVDLGEPNKVKDARDRLGNLLSKLAGRKRTAERPE